MVAGRLMRITAATNSTYSNPDPLASIVATPLMTTPSGGMTDWNFVSIDLTAHTGTELLSFLAWGNNGNTVNLPPMVFLTGVDSGPASYRSPHLCLSSVQPF